MHTTSIRTLMACRVGNRTRTSTCTSRSSTPTGTIRTFITGTITSRECDNEYYVQRRNTGR
jgi:hypothetical protein